MASRPPNSARSSAAIALGTFLSRILGMLKTMAMTLALGVTIGVSNIFTSANNLPNLIYLLITGGVINQVLVPQIIKASRRKDQGADYVSRLITLFTLIFLAITGVVVALHRPILSLLTSNWNGEQLALGAIFTLWSLPQIFFYGMYAILGQTLNAYGSFAPYAWAPVINNVISLGGIIIFIITQGINAANPHTISNWTNAQTALIAGSATLGVIIQALILILPLRSLGLEIRPRFGWRGIGLGQAVRIASWALMTTFLGNFVNLVLMRSASTTTAAQEQLYASGSLEQIPAQTVLDSATLIYILPHSVITLSIVTVLFNKMASAATRKSHETVAQVLRRSLNSSGVATIFSMVAMIVLAPGLGMMLSGNNVTGGILTATTIIPLAIGLPFYSASFIMNRVFYSYEDAKTPFKIGVCVDCVLLIIAFTSLLLPPRWIIFFIAVGISLSNIIAVGISHRFLVRRYGNWRADLVVNKHIRMGYAAFIAGIAGETIMIALRTGSVEGYVWTNYLTSTLTIVFVGIIMFIIYAASLKIFKIEELKEIIKPFTSRLSR